MRAMRGRGILLLHVAAGSSLASFHCVQNEAVRKPKRRKKKYVIVGAGVAGRSCLSQLVHDSPDIQKDILVIDTNSDALQSLQKTTSGVETCCTPICDFSVNNATIHLKTGEVVEFEKCLLATGKDIAKLGTDMLSTDCSEEQIIYIQPNSTKQLQLLKTLVCTNRHVTILGGTWYSLAVASYLAPHQSKPGLVTLVCPGPGPLHQVLPKYLSESINQRLVRQGVDVLPHSQVRYIGGKDTLQLPVSRAPAAEQIIELEGEFVVMHLCRTYDSLYTSMFPTDAVVLSSLDDSCNDLGFQNVSEVESRREISNENVKSTDSSRMNSRSWLCRSGLEMDRYGCIVVNRSLLAANNVYVAGDLASYPYSYANNGFSSKLFGPNRYYRGHDVGLVSAAQTGALAGQNMLRSRCEGGNLVPTYHAMALSSGINFQFYGDCTNNHSSYSYWLKHSNLSSRNKASVPKTHKSNAKNLYGQAGVIFYVDDMQVIRGILLCGSSDSTEEPSFVGDSINSIVGRQIDSNERNTNISELRQLASMIMSKHNSLNTQPQASDMNQLSAPPSALYFTFSRPRVLNGRVVSGSKSVMKPSVLSVTNNAAPHPWKYSVQGSVSTENIFYHRKPLW